MIKRLMERCFWILWLLLWPNLAGAANPGADPLVEVKTLMPDVVLDVRYATANNFLKSAVYPEARVLLRASVVERLKKAEAQLKTIGYGIKIFDGYRPFSVQKKMWELVPDSRYVAKVSLHNRGGAIDMTLVKLDGSPVTMPTEYDDFTPTAHHGSPLATPEAAQNARLLKRVMEEAGFVSVATEWWHYHDPKIKSYPVLDVPFSEIKP